MRSELDRFEEKIEKIPISGCWIWTGTTYRKGYGHFRRKVNGRWVMYKAHRFSYEQFIGPLPEGLNVLHHCDITCCVNPDHLFVGTLQDNHDDMIAKDRKIIGRNPKHQWLSKEIAEDIRAVWQTTGMSQAELANEWGISTAQMSRILNNKIWK